MLMAACLLLLALLLGAVGLAILLITEDQKKEQSNED